MPRYIKSNFVQNVFIKSGREDFLSHVLKDVLLSDVSNCSPKIIGAEIKYYKIF